MREAAFIRKNKLKWKSYETQPASSPDALADRFIELTDDLAYARTFYPESDTTAYLNGLTGRTHQAIYRNKKEKRNRIARFWKYELPYLFRQHHRQLFYAFLVFAVACGLGALSAAMDDTFVRLILGDHYVNMTLENIRKGDPMAVYKSSGEAEMFLYITINNIRVSFLAFVMGVFFSIGTFWVLFQNGVMLGAFQYFFYKQGLLVTSMLTIWIHGTLEIAAIVIAGCAGFVMGNSLLFPKTYSRMHAFKQGARRGLKIVMGLVPVFITAGFLEGFVTRHTSMPLALSLFIILSSAAFILYYFILYPRSLHQKHVPDPPEN
ncbi:putative membrane protein SpoIIM required for sporulation [Pontibacter mucosus]|uniref:Putative membrane protein SpoIIM required for sporulation n=1 Tax=Pontibacter mucosus TaxID=1649266 RepID=A0A2T5YGC4_9BACT|nr:stage II sporulation protein M [Pontibacter mucosus]PTX18346.1 putative membrane protein SpoIIM required for sporulation [Pontibacter mucosus]